MIRLGLGLGLGLELGFPNNKIIILINIFMMSLS